MDETDQTPPPPPPPPTTTTSTFLPPSIHREALVAGSSFTHFSPVPPTLLTPTSASDPASLPPLCLGVDEAGRGPVLGPMVYGIFYLPLPLSDPLLRTTHHFDDSKVLTAAARSSLMQTLCTQDTDLHANCGWATAALSARDISANMLRPLGVYNLNAQAMDATIALIKGAFDRGLNIREIYVDTIGQPATYQAKLQRVFPTTSITVAKKADSLYPCVSAASVCAKVTRDAALEVLYDARRDEDAAVDGAPPMEWGSGYPSDARCVNWLRRNMHPVFGWGPECRFSWGTAKDMLESGGGVKVQWPAEEGEGADSMRVTDFLVAGRGEDKNELGGWYGSPVGPAAF
ncbi:Ribonuclease H2 subunit A [Metarhizium album ARSEF 1941]|uniref:Ribonuclease n=1 Tax=Metarhizium album (strain ARSEF 1941) TaxID=1081103 RepID=A0A0B2WWY3_METAS|nr:Ribonuclease H2 subunit A [Metarhizium album ARSEF 1941]KHN97375.1 Ribonuclease H2 subunit A [Metarhizium album ARSEF 1941]